MKNINKVLGTLVLAALLVAAIGFVGDWLEFVPVNGSMKLIIGSDNIQAAKDANEIWKMENRLVGFKTLESAHITVYYPQSAKFGADDLEKMETAYLSANEFLGVDRVADLGHKLIFVWAPGRTADGKLLIEELADTTGGRAYPDLGVLYSKSIYAPHEVNHVVARSIGRPTALLSEGFANYLNKVDWEHNVRRLLVQAKEQGTLVPLSELVTSDGFWSHSDRVAYPQASVFAKLLIEEKGKDKFIDLYRRTQADTTLEEFAALIQEIYGESFEELDTQYSALLEAEIGQ